MTWKIEFRTQPEVHLWQAEAEVKTNGFVFFNDSTTRRSWLTGSHLSSGFPMPNLHPLTLSTWHRGGCEILSAVNCLGGECPQPPLSSQRHAWIWLSGKARFPLRNRPRSQNTISYLFFPGASLFMFPALCRLSCSM